MASRCWFPLPFAAPTDGDQCAGATCNGGRCLDLVGDFACPDGSLPPGVSPCTNAPCLHNGRCVPNPAAPPYFSCECPTHLRGDLCQFCELSLLSCPL